MIIAGDLGFYPKNELLAEPQCFNLASDTTRAVSGCEAYLATQAELQYAKWPSVCLAGIAPGFE